MDNHEPYILAGTTRMDPSLVARACQGDRQAQDSVLSACRAPLARFADSLLPVDVRATTDAQDVVQDVLASATRRLGHISCDGERDLLAYLFRSVRHRVVDVIRQRARRPHTTPLWESLPAPDPSPLDAAMQTQERQRLRTALRGLRRRDRHAVMLRLGRHSYEEIAARLGSPTANAARVTVRRAADRLGGLLGASATGQSRMRRYRA